MFRYKKLTYQKGFVIKCVFSDSTRTGLTPSYDTTCEASCIVSCPEGWESYGNRCYFWSEEKKTWSDAEEECKKSGSHLASVPNHEVHKYMQDKAEEQWIGGFFDQETETWVWTDCSAWNYNPGWGQGKLMKSSSDCLRYSFDEDWEDVMCFHSYPKFVCSTKVCSGRIKAFKYMKFE